MIVTYAFFVVLVLSESVERDFCFLKQYKGSRKKSFFRGVGGRVGGHLTFQILTLLRYVVDIGLNSPNPKFF